MKTDTTEIYSLHVSYWLLTLLGMTLLIVSAYDALLHMIHRWDTSEEYGYGYMIPVITAFLIWQRKDKLERMPFVGSWAGVIVMVIGAMLILVGQLSTIYTVTQYGFVIAVIGAVYTIVGWRVFRILFVPLVLLFLMIPLPGFAFNNLSSQLQLISSQIGVAVIRLFDISVYLEGNVIDLGTYQLQVVEACSGLRYLFPLIALSIISSYFYQAAIWKRVIVIISSVPITVFMNSFRIGVIGVLVEYYGIEQAEGFLHDFEGWIVFMACVLLLIIEMWALTLIGKEKQSFREIFGMEFPEPAPSNATVVKRDLPRHVFAGIIVIVLGALLSFEVGGREEHIPLRASFNEFPMSLGAWSGRNDTLDGIVLDVLKLDDYLLADFRDGDGKPVNLYIAYYGSQRSGASAHSPASCLPGGGWRIESHDHVALNTGVAVNRFVIRKGEYRSVVYYWFKQRDRVITNEFLVKWYLLWDALFKNRTDGALVRMTINLGPGDDPQIGDDRLQAFASEIVPILNKFIPD